MEYLLFPTYSKEKEKQSWTILSQAAIMIWPPLRKQVRKELFLSALPMAITRPLLEYRRLNAQVDVIMRAIEANEKTREDIMKTIRELGAAGQLTPELAPYLFAAYNQALIQLPI